MTPPTEPEPGLPPLVGRKILVTGTTGAGKSTMARSLAARLVLPYTEVDALFHGPGWVRRPAFEDDVAAAVAGAEWVLDAANYSSVKDLLWSSADTLVWLDYGKPLVMSRVLRRSFARATYARQLWNGNTEGFRDWVDPEHPIRWAWSTYDRRRAENLARIADPQWSGLAVVRLRSPRDASAWLRGLPDFRP
jgi:adenylate kinase family enzyme